MVEALSLCFMGVGNAKASALGSAAAVLEVNAQPALLIDCGPRTLDDFAHHYGERLPPAVFLTHLHLDHIGGIEPLFYRAYFSGLPPIKLFVPSYLIAGLHEKLANSAHVLSEGGVNFWDAFQLIPVSEHFWLEKILFDVFPVRHSGYRGAFGLALKGAFFYSGDTRPIPEITSSFANANELIFHDCAEHGSPAHTGLADFVREYSEETRARAIVYHYESVAAAERLAHAGLQVARPGQRFTLQLPALRDSMGAPELR
jgi:ribonuclease BN (tRNA processing enzyme)